MHIKLHISLSGHSSTPITVKSINKTLRGELINTVINCSNSSNNIFFLVLNTNVSIWTFL